MLAGELIKNCPEEAAGIDITGIFYDSRKVTQGSAFVCIKGYETDGHRFAASAAENGAALIVAEDKVDVPVPVVYVKDSRRTIAEMAAEFTSTRPAKMPVSAWVPVTVPAA